MECDPENAVIASRRRIQSLMEQKRSVAYPWCVWSVHARGVPEVLNLSLPCEQGLAPKQYEHGQNEPCESQPG